MEKKKGGRVAKALPTTKAKNFKGSFKRVIGLLAPERFLLSLMLVLGIVSVVLSVAAPTVLGHATNLIFNGVVGGDLEPGQTKEQAVDGLRAAGNDTVADLVSGMDVTPGAGIDFGAVGTVLLWVLALYVVSALLAWAQGYILNIALQRRILLLRGSVEAKVHRLPLQYFDNNARGETLSRVTNDIDNVSTSLQQTLSQLITGILTVLGILGVMIWISPLLALVALLTIPASFLVTALIAKRSQPHFVAQWKHTGKLNAQIEETYTGHEIVKAFGRQAEVEREFGDRNEKLFQAGFRAQFISGLIMPIIMFLGNINYVVVAVVGGLRVASGTLSLGEVQAFIQYSRQFTQPLSQVGAMINLIQSGVASAERIFEVLDADEEDPDVVPASSPTERRGRVVFDDVSFSYSPEQPLIQNLSLTADPGHLVAIVGPTGAGKTTLVNLIMRFYEIDSGRITLDGVDTRKMTRDELRSRTGMVLQDTWLFGGTIRDNIAYGDPTASEEEILEAARVSYVDKFVHSLPDGYDTIIDEEGNNVSAGEKQLITIARAFLAKPLILILDEATSSVDTRTELLVQKATAALRNDRTSFVIAHRLSTIRDADTIVVMENGSIVEQGNHEELLEAKGAYYRLYSS
ncbi:ABC transporter ATP-binding protein [Rhodococcus fascians]|uniref:ABC transporter ATP-binding protein n=1 Tax=Rhodococcoides fascians TaxID=1828 RepID=UPI0019580A3F|nr:ABC transporter ATP-binding protein [Rhodococcus fascians]MBY3809183.1 ABC transporter ATP-binding protein [Rhodococcus fascians]MBY3840869.1 ABC transporter ATP-binding protein [Rhodococcus fascians]MBY3846354.1 ABC transporter ATP-binding protein [Rhodococcus fascians]MBY3851075.1 ABC transporter ATP-binding protein [Rhodococcus fascians]